MDEEEKKKEETLQHETDKTVAEQKPWLFKKGQSGNPKGRPVGKLSVVGAIKKKLQDIPEGEEERTYLDALITQIFIKAIRDGDVTMIKEIITRVDGLPKQKIEFDDVSDNNNPLLDILKNQDGKRREQTIKQFNELLREADEGSSVPNEPTNDDRKGDIPKDEGKGGMETR